MKEQQEVTVRALHKLEEYEECVRLQGEAWGFAPLEIVPVPLFVVAAETGGQVFGAFVREGERDGRATQEKMVGFLMAMAGVRDGRAYIHSHMTAVMEEWRDRGVARRLKLMQRDEALGRGIGLVEWTFDPLEVKNAYFNLVKLGAVVRRYLPNCYGRTTSPLHGGLPTDRLVAEWWLESERVKGIVAGKDPTSGGRPWKKRIKVPGNIAEMKRTNPDEAERIQRQIREEFFAALGEGYAAVGFERESDGGGAYLMGEE